MRQAAQHQQQNHNQKGLSQINTQNAKDIKVLTAQMAALTKATTTAPSAPKVPADAPFATSAKQADTSLPWPCQSCGEFNSPGHTWCNPCYKGKGKTIYRNQDVCQQILNADGENASTDPLIQQSKQVTKAVEHFTTQDTAKQNRGDMDTADTATVTLQTKLAALKDNLKTSTTNGVDQKYLGMMQEDIAGLEKDIIAKQTFKQKDLLTLQQGGLDAERKYYGKKRELDAEETRILNKQAEQVDTHTHTHTRPKLRRCSRCTKHRG